MKDAITLRWNEVAGATGYNVRYAEEDCSGHDCVPDGGSTSLTWVTPAASDIVITQGNSVVEAGLRGLSRRTRTTLFRVEVQAVNASGVSDWSDAALVYPTDGQLSQVSVGSGKTANPQVATIGITSYQLSGRFEYVLCTMPPIPSGITVADITNAIAQWETNVRWAGSTANIVTASGRTSTTCTEPNDMARTNNQVIFLSDREMNMHCKPTALGCWAWPHGSLDTPPGGQTIIMRASEDWSAIGSGGCTRLQEVMAHETGHAMGFQHARLPASIMRPRYNHSQQLCNPTAYDIVAMMANYQSR